MSCDVFCVPPCGAASRWARRFEVSPALPLGLLLDETTGAITGFPSVEVPATSRPVVSESFPIRLDGSI